mgnify:FL=1
MDLVTIILVLVILFVSSLVRSTLGFGDALIAMPLVVMLVGIKAATPLIAIIAIIIASYIAITNKEHLNLKSTYKLIIFTILGIPIGLFWLKEVDETIVKITLAVIIILFALFRLYRPHLVTIKTEKFSFLFGIISGILGGAYNTNGPPIIIYGTLRRWEPKNFRVILQGVLLPTNIFIAAGHGISGLWTINVILLLLYSLPVVIFAIILGTKLHNVLPKDKYDKIIYYALILIGAMLIINSLK